MTKEQVEARKQALVAQKTQLVAQVHAVLGAIEDCDYWLAELAKPQENP